MADCRNILKPNSFSGQFYHLRWFEKQVGAKKKKYNYPYIDKLIGNWRYKTRKNNKRTLPCQMA